MSDITIGALIGLGGVVLGSIITGIINYRNSRLQIAARLDETGRQLAFNEEQARIERLIKLRQVVLHPLKEVVSRWMVAANRNRQMTVRLGEAYKKKRNTDEMAGETKLWQESEAEASLVTSELEVLQGQLGDPTLARMIDDVIEAYWEASPDASKLQVIFLNPEGRSTDSLLDLLKEHRSIINSLRGRLLAVNRRIDDLLAGETPH